ncbi:hypothetical protein Tsubulata_020577, partial [Turnera subulata]
MTKKKIIWNSIFGCYRSSSLPEIKNPVLKQSSFQRLSLSDVSNPSSPLCIEDLSNSFVGSKLYTFTFAELRVITENFSRSNLIGEGGFGPVYKGFIDDKLRRGLEAQPVAVKSLDLDGLQGHKEWMAEIVFLGQLRHPNLVKLIGYCCEEDHRVLVYEYMPRGSLENQLFGKFSVALPWSVRMKIALEAAKGLAFLHENEKPVIFRDFKSSNILLDSDYTVKLSDFGLAKDGPEGEQTHVTTRVMGTQGYAAPEYIMTGHLTTMSDVYSFGVVLLELLTGRRSLDSTRPGREQSLVGCVRPLLKDQSKLDKIIDPRLDGQFSCKGAQKIAALAYKCLSHHPKPRPPMSYVVRILESLQDFDDTFAKPFVYVVQNENGREESLEKVRGWRHRIKEHLSRVALSDFGLYENLESGLSLSDVSDPSSPKCIEDLSNSFIGSKLYIFTLAELKAITKNFSRSNQIGEGGFGPVYKGFVDGKLRQGLDAQPVAVKSLAPNGLQGHKEWLGEIVFLGQLRHPNLVKLIGYCCEEDHRLLVYEYLPRGSLENQLFRRYSVALPWSVRMKIALEAAKGLAFLHDNEKPVIFRDFKSSNILLDSDYTVKLSDFGLAKDGPQGQATHVTTRVMGTQGYAAPEYIMTGHLTTMSDVYSFGVVLLELLTGKRPIDSSRPGREQSLVEWARPLLRDSSKIDKIIDPRLVGQFSYRGAQKEFDDAVVKPFVYIVPNESWEKKKF